jgi:hypothetical protein
MKKKDKIDKFDRPAYKTPKTHTRTGSMTVLSAPSRIHNTLFYPDGTTKHESKTPNKTD